MKLDLIKNFVLNFSKNNQNSRFFCILEILFHYLFLFLFISTIYGKTIGTIIAISVSAIGILRIKKYNLLWIISLLAWLFIPFLWQYENHIKNILSEAPYFIYAFRFCVVLLIYSIAMLLISKNSYKTLFIYLISNICLYAVFYSFSSEENLFVLLGRYFLNVYKYFIVPISYGIFYKPVEKYSFFKKLKKISLFLPAWNLRPVLPISYASDLDQYDHQINTAELKKSLQSASRLTIITLACFVILIFIRFFFYQNQFFYYYNLSIKNEYPQWSFVKIAELSAGYEAAFEVNKTFYQKGLSIILSFVNMYAQIVLMLNISVILARACGYQIKSTFNQPWLATSISQFYGKILYYYNHALMNLFVIPINESLQFIKHKLIRFYISLFLGILIGGFYFHLFVRDFERIFRTNFIDTLYSYLPTLFYFSAISFIVTISYLPFFNFWPKAYIHLPRWVKIIFYFFVWCLVYNLYVATHHAKASFTQYLDYILGLLPFSFY